MLSVSLNDTWLSNVVHYLTYGECPKLLSLKKKELEAEGRKVCNLK